MDEWQEGAKKEGKKGSKGTATRTREALGAKGKARAEARARVKPDTAMTAESKETSE